MSNLIDRDVIDQIMTAATPTWKANSENGSNPMPTEETEDALRRYITFALLKRFMEAFEQSPAAIDSAEVSLNFKMTRDGDFIDLVCTPVGWERDKFIRCKYK